MTTLVTLIINWGAHDTDPDQACIDSTAFDMRPYVVSDYIDLDTNFTEDKIHQLHLKTVQDIVEEHFSSWQDLEDNWSLYECKEKNHTELVNSSCSWGYYMFQDNNHQTRGIDLCPLYFECWTELGKYKHRHSLDNKPADTASHKILCGQPFQRVHSFL